jgi:hypothetical protein
MRPKALLIAAGLIACLFLLRSSLQTTAEERPRIKLIPTAVSPDRRPVMQGKLEDSQTALRGLVTADYALIRKGAEQMCNTALHAELAAVNDDPVYSHFSTEFRRLATKLVERATQEDLEGAAYTFQNLTTTCIACHQHVRDSMSLAD